VEATDNNTQDMSRTALVVDADRIQLASTSEALRALGYEVIAALTFDDARRHLLAMQSLSLLVADIRLGQFNGLHLAFRARAHHPHVRLVVTDHAFDTTLEAETKRLGGAYIARPFTTDILATLVARPEQSAAGSPLPSTPRRWPRRHVAGVVAAVGPREARLFDVSYGGLCLEFPRGDFDATLPSTLDIELTGIGLSLRMHPVWVRTTSTSPAWLCGGEVIASDPPAMMQWREFVDSHLPA
jgi:ActR/RegA family two-component response regulator